MFKRKEPEVLVVGAGPVGLFAALRLTRRGIRVRIVDKQWRTGAHSYALALHQQALELFNEVGLLTRVLGDGYRVRRLGFYQAHQRCGTLQLEASRGDSSVVVLRQDLLERILEEALRESGVEVDWNHQVSQLIPNETGVEVTIDKLVKDSVGYAVSHTEWVVEKSTNTQVPWVIGADGHRSFVRRALGIDFADTAPPQHFAVFEFETDFDLNHEMRVVFDNGTTSAVWPLADGICRWSFQLEQGVSPESSRIKDRTRIQIGRANYPVLEETSLRSLLDQRAPWFEGKINQVLWRLLVRFDSRMASRFGDRRVWLAGDAGHMTGPVGMQSMNVGLREAAELADIIAGVLQDDGPTERFAAYDRKRQSEWQYLLSLASRSRARDTAQAWAHQYAGRLVPCLPASGEALAKLADRLAIKIT